MASMFELGPATEGLRRDVADPLHAQISDAIRARIVAGDWAVGHRLPSEPELASEIGVSRGTLRRALSTLIDEGLLRQQPGLGTFVSETPRPVATPQTISTIAEDLTSQGVAFTTRVLASELVAPPLAVAQLLGLGEGQLVLRLERVRSVDDQPITLLRNYVRADLAPGIQDVDFSSTRLFDALEREHGLEIGTARRSFSAIQAPAHVVEALALPEHVPVQHLEQLTQLADGTPVEYSDVWIDSRRLRVVTHLHGRDTAEERDPA